MDIEQYLIWIILTSFWCWGFHNAFEPGELFGKIGDCMREKFTEFQLKPIIGCPICMSSIHGTTWYFISQPVYSFTSWIMFIVAASGFNYVIHNIFPPSDINVTNNY
jgi:hypothetical protein